MSWNSSPLRRLGRSLPGHLSDLSDRLRDIAERVRATVASVVGEAVARAVQDGLQRLWTRRPPAEPSPWRAEPEYDSRDWRDLPDHDGWEDPDSVSPAYPTSEASYPTPKAYSPPPSTLVALALKAAGWWLYRRGTWAGALGLGLVVGSIAMLGGTLAAKGLGLAEAAAEVMTLDDALTRGAGALSH